MCHRRKSDTIPASTLRLRTAAPDMYIVLAKCVRFLEQHAKTETFGNGIPMPNPALQLLNYVKETLAKAEGGEMRPSDRTWQYQRNCLIVSAVLIALGAFVLSWVR